MFDAAKFVVAGAIVALFGGSMLAGVMPPRPSEEVAPAVKASSPAAAEPTQEPPTPLETYAEMRSRLVTEKAANRIDRVLDDGVGHTFYQVAEPFSVGSVWYRRIAFAPDGSAWLDTYAATEDEVLDEVIRIGEIGSLTGGTGFHSLDDLEVAPDGTIWALRPDDSGQTHVVSLEGSQWDRHDSGSVSHGALEILADGSVWTRDRRALRRFDGDEWSVFPFSEAGIALPTKDGRWVFANDMAAAPDGTLWLAFDTTDEQGGLARFDGTSWARVDPLGKRYQSKADAVAVGDGSVVWAALAACRGRGCLDDASKHRYFLARFDGERWTVFDEDDGAAQTNAPGGWATEMAVSPDGLLLTTLRKPGGMGSVALFDAAGRRAMIPREEMSAAGIGTIRAAPDGTFWILTGGVRIYIYTPPMAGD